MSGSSSNQKGNSSKCGSVAAGDKSSCSSNDAVFIYADVFFTRLAASRRPTLLNLDQRIFPDGGPRSSSLIEIRGESNTGKSLFLLELIAKAILPTQFGGKNAGVVLFNVDGKFSILEFWKLLEKMIGRNSTSSGDSSLSSSTSPAAPRSPTSAEGAEVPTDVDGQYCVREIVEESLKKMHIFNCYSQGQYDVAMHSVEDLLLKNNDIALLAVDSICSFYWLECRKQRIQMETYYRNTVGKLKDLCKRHNTVGAYVRPSFLAARLCRSTVDVLGCRLYDYRFELRFLSKDKYSGSGGNVHDDGSSRSGFKGIEMICDIDGKLFTKCMTVDDNGIKIIQ